MGRKRRRNRWFWAGILLSLTLVAGYTYLTNPERLRAVLLELIPPSTPYELSVADVHFSPWGGLEITNLILWPARPLDDNTNPDHWGDPPVLQVAQARVGCGFWPLLIGKFQPRSIEVNGVEINVVRGGRRRPEGSLFTPLVEELGAADSEVWAALSGLRATLMVDRADTRVWKRDPNGRRRLLQRWIVYVAGAPTERGYGLRVTQNPNSERWLAQARWDAHTHAVTVRLDWFDLDRSEDLLPSAVTAVMADLGLGGRVQLSELRYRVPGRGGPAPVYGVSAEVAMSGISLAIPIERDQEHAWLPPNKRFLQLQDLAGVVSLREVGQAGVSQFALKLRGRCNDSPAALDATGRWMVTAEAQDQPATRWQVDSLRVAVDNLTFPTHETEPLFVKSPLLPRGFRGFINDFRPQGRCRIVATAKRPQGAEPNPDSVAGGLNVQAEVEALGARCAYKDFPYPFSDVRGRLLLHGHQITIDGMTARHGSALVTANGTVTEARSWGGFDLVFQAQNVPLDRTLYRALPEHYKHVWAAAKPLGLCDLDVQLQRRAGSEAEGAKPTDTRIAARLLRGSLSLGQEQRFRLADGTIEISEGVLRMHNLHGHLDQAQARVDGLLDTRSEGQPGELRVHVCGTPLDFQTQVAGHAPNDQITVRLDGHADVWGQIHGRDMFAKRHANYAVRLNRGTLTGFAPQAPWQHAKGWFVVGEDRIEIRALSAQQDAASLEASGVVGMPLGSAGPLQLEIRAEDAEMADLVERSLPPAWRPMGRALGLAGRGWGTLRVNRQASGPGQQHHPPDVQLELEAARMQPEAVPIPLEKLAARLVTTAEGLAVQHVRATHGPEGVIAGAGEFRWGEGEHWTQWALTAEEIDLTPQLITAMPGGLGRLLTQTKPGGRLTAVLDQLLYQGDQNSGRWNVRGRLTFNDGQLQLGLPLNSFNGAIDGTCEVDTEGEVTLAAQFSIDNGRLAERPIERWEGRVWCQPDQRWVHLDELSGRLCDGEILGFTRIDPRTTEYELSLTLDGVLLAQLFPPKNTGDQNPPRPGRLDGRVFLRGSADDPNSRVGGGELRIRGGSFLETPVLASVAEATDQPEEILRDPLDLAELRFVWQGSELRLTRIDIQSRSLRMVGKGTWNIESNLLALELVGAHPKHWPRVLLLSDLLEVAGQELMQYHVRGSAAAPRVTVEPLHKLNDSLRVLLGGDGPR